MPIRDKNEKKVYIYGRHAVAEALSSARKGVLKKVFLAPEVDDRELKELIRRSGVPISNLSGSKKASNSIVDVSHQGVVGLVDTRRLTQPYKEFMDELTVNKNSMLVILGELHDPQNIGAIIRSAAALGAAGVLMPEHNQGRITGAVIKVSAGMAFRVPLVSIGNVNSTIKDLKEKGFWAYALDMGGKKKLQDEAFDAPTVFVFGNESAGVRQKTLEACDEILSISMKPECESLNVAASAAIAMYQWGAKR